MKPLKASATGAGAAGRTSHVPPVTSGSKLVTQDSSRSQLASFPFQPLPPPNGPAPYRFDLSQLLSAEDIASIKANGTRVFHTVGDTGDFRGQQMDFVAAMLTADAKAVPAAFFYHLGDVVYFCGDISGYAPNFYETYKDYPGFIVAIPGNHDCQPSDPSEPPVPNKFPLDGWIKNFMSKTPAQLGAQQTGSARTQLDLPNVYWTFTTPFATIIGLFSNVGETQGEIHPDQVGWFQSELKAADPDLALIVAVHHPPFSGDVDHSGSSEVDTVLSTSFKAAGRWPHLVLSGHVHNYQRFTNTVQGPKGPIQIPCVVAGAGGYTKLGTLQTIDGAPPKVPLTVDATLTLEQYDDRNFGFMRLEVSKTQIVGTYYSAQYVAGGTPMAKQVDQFQIDLAAFAVKTLSNA